MPAKSMPIKIFICHTENNCEQYWAQDITAITKNIEKIQKMHFQELIIIAMLAPMELLHQE